MITINKAALHILDLSSGITVLSQKEIDPANQTATGYLARHIEKSLQNATVKNGRLKPESRFLAHTNNYLGGQINFIAYTSGIAEEAYAILSRCDKQEATDLVVCDFDMEGRRGLALMLLYNKSAFTHYVNQDETGTWNDIIRHQALLPAAGQKIESFAIIDPLSLQVDFADRKVKVDGGETHILPELLLECTSAPSSQDTLKIVEKAVKAVAESNGKDPLVAVSKAKSYVGGTTSSSGELAAEKMGQEIFESEALQKAFVEETQRAGLPQTVKVNQAYAARRSRTHKIKTDTGIELLIPVEYFENPEFVEFVNQSDGSISIQLKNINEIIN